MQVVECIYLSLDFLLFGRSLSSDWAYLISRTPGPCDLGPISLLAGTSVFYLDSVGCRLCSGFYLGRLPGSCFALSFSKNRDRLNQPPTGEGKKQSPRSGEANKLHKRAEVLQASQDEQNIGTAEEEEALRSQQQSANPKRPKAGR